MHRTPFASLNRRHFLKHLAGWSALALPGMQLLQSLQAAAPALRRDRKSLIILWMNGGPPTIDLWDMKPGQPTAGEFRPISTSADGIQICEHLPNVAQQMKHLSVIRSLTTSEGDHLRGRVLMHTSRRPDPAVHFPSIGSVVSNHLASKDLPLPGFISVGGVSEGPGFLGMNYAPFAIQNPGQPPANLRPPPDLGGDQERMERTRRRQRLFFTVEDHFIAEKQGDAARAHGEIYGKAFNLVASPLGKVFNLASEPRRLIEEYGNTGFGRGCLLARKLVEAGVTCVEVDMAGWDLHAKIFPTLKDQRLPMLDKGMAALVRDLQDRGMWKNTVVLCMGEFGRTPHVNQNAGRDHWARCWSVVIGGGAIRGGRVVGATNADGTAVERDPVSVGDLFATVYKALGLDPASEMHDQGNRPFPLAEGKPLSTLI